MRKSILTAALVAAALPAATTVTIDSAEARPHHAERRYHNDHGVRYWRGSNGRYYCKRSNGTTGLLIGGVAGGLLGNAVVGGTGGTLLGVAGGALAGRAIDRNNSRPRCR